MIKLIYFENLTVKLYLNSISVFFYYVHNQTLCKNK